MALSYMPYSVYQNKDNPFSKAHCSKFNVDMQYLPVAYK